MTTPPLPGRLLKLALCLGFVAASVLSESWPLALASPQALLTGPLLDSWPTYSGDYSGKRYSALSAINQSTVKHLTLAWVTRLAAGPGSTEGGRGRGGARNAGPGRGGASIIVGGEGTEFAGGSTNVRGSILEVDGVLYATTPDNAWAIDARDGREIWHYVWKTKGGTHIGNRGMGMWGTSLYMETPDDYLVSLDARTGHERWHKVISDFSQQYFSTMAPIVVGNHVLVGTGDDLDAPGFLQSFDPETGDLQWKFYTVPMNPGDPGLDTWASLDAARHGGGHAWNPGSYDPETHLYIFGTGNPTPAYTAHTRGEGDNLFTCALVAVNVDTGKMAWYYQTSPHDTHDWDAAQTPVLVDAAFGGRPRKLVMTAERNGYFFVLDRVTGEHLLTSQFSKTVNWAKGLNDKGQPVRNPAKDFDIGGALVSSTNAGATNWPPASFSPDTGLFYVPLVESYAMYYLTETDPRGAMGLGGTEEIGVGSEGSYLAAIDYRTGKAAWKHRYPGTGGGGGNGILTTAGRLVFAGDLSGNLVAYDAATGRILWHARLGQISNAPETYRLDGRQYILAASGDSLYAFTLIE
jgi:alcohol dehydrogenase (cytochrome c)